MKIKKLESIKLEKFKLNTKTLKSITGAGDDWTHCSLTINGEAMCKRDNIIV